MRYFKRLLGLPFFLGLVVIGSVFQIVIKSYLWMRYGGEAINYYEDRKTILDVYNKVSQLG